MVRQELAGSEPPKREYIRRLHGAGERAIIKQNEKSGPELVGYKKSGQHPVHYIEFSKDAVDKIIANSVGTDKEDIIFVVKSPPLRDHFTYDEFVNYSWEQLDILTRPGGARAARAKKAVEGNEKVLTANKLDSLAQFTEINSGQKIEIGSFSVTPISVVHFDYNSESPLPGCVMYVIQLPDKKKIVIGWDFLSINNVDENLLWNPDILILGTETYNHHPSAGTLSITEAFDFVRRWNAKECYIVHYSGLIDIEDGKNQWFRGPVKAMTSMELQNTINDQLKLSGGGGKFRMTVAHEGMTW